MLGQQGRVGAFDHDEDPDRRRRVWLPENFIIKFSNLTNLGGGALYTPWRTLCRSSKKLLFACNYSSRRHSDQNGLLVANLFLLDVVHRFLLACRRAADVDNAPVSEGLEFR